MTRALSAARCSHPLDPLRGTARRRNGGHVGRDKDGRFAVKPTFTIEGAVHRAQDRMEPGRPPHASTNSPTTATARRAWKKNGAPDPDRLEFPLDAASHPQHAIYHLAEPLPAADGRVLVVTLETADLGRARFSVTPFGGAIPGYENAHRPELATALATPAGIAHADQDPRNRRRLHPRHHARRKTARGIRRAPRCHPRMPRRICPLDGRRSPADGQNRHRPLPAARRLDESRAKKCNPRFPSSSQASHLPTAHASPASISPTG